jgi:hypothetical protein
MDSSTPSSSRSSQYETEQTPPSDAEQVGFSQTPGGIALIVIFVLIGLFLIIFLPILFVVIRKSSYFPITWVSPMIAGSITMNVPYSLDAVNQMATINFPQLNFAVAANENGYGIVAPGNSSFPSTLVPYIGAQSLPTATTVITFVGGTQNTAQATLTLNVDGTIYITPNAPVFFGSANGTSVSIAACSMTYQTAVSPPVLTYGTVPNFGFNASFLAAEDFTTLYYSTNATHTLVNLVIPTLAFNSGATTGSTVTSASTLSATGPKLTPAITQTGNLLQPAFNNGISNTNQFSINTSGSISLTNNQAPFVANQTGISYGFLVIQYPI